jgi:N6-adenosine-specific RNA methylase IME4
LRRQTAPCSYELLDAWGFKHKTTAFTWVKQNPSGEGWHMGQGFYTRANPEQCWLGICGHPERLDASVQQLIVSPVLEHSRKPDEARVRIERLVGGPYLELNARRPRPGWYVWGDEIKRGMMIPHDPDTGEVIEQDGAAIPSSARAELAAAVVPGELSRTPVIGSNASVECGA